MNMNKQFKRIISKIPTLQKRLDASPLIPVIDSKHIPQQGIYVFFEKGKPMYVGRSNRMSSRIREHFQPTSQNTSAPFAFNIAKKQAAQEGIDIGHKRTELEKDSVFQQLFVEAKKRVSNMAVKVIEVSDPVFQTMFEVYASLYYGTHEFNDFATY
jgi:hypothetical protein